MNEMEIVTKMADAVFGKLDAYHESRGGCDAPEAGPSDTPEALLFRAQCQLNSVQNAYAKYEEAGAELYADLAAYNGQLTGKLAAMAAVRTQMDALLEKLTATLDEAMKAIREA